MLDPRKNETLDVVTSKKGPVPHWYDKGTSVSFAQGHRNPSTSLPCPTQWSPLNSRTHGPFAKKRRTYSHTHLRINSLVVPRAVLELYVTVVAAGLSAEYRV